MALAADVPIDDLLDDHGYTDPGNDIFVAGPFTTRVSAGTLTDNFLDAAHFPILHAATFGAQDDGRPQIAAARDLQIAVGVEDLWILEQMDEPWVPLDVRAEVHTKADLGCLEYRRMLAELAGSAG